MEEGVNWYKQLCYWQCYIWSMYSVAGWGLGGLGPRRYIVINASVSIYVDLWTCKPW